MATLEEVFRDLGEQVKNGECKKAGNGVCYSDRILKIAGLRNLTVKVSASSDGRYFMSMYRGNKMTKQIMIYADDADDFETISAFLRKYSDTISKYTSRRSRNTNNAKEVEVDVDENEEQGEEEQKENKSQKKSGKPKKVNVEDEF